MKFGQEIDHFIRWFYVCGLSSYPSFDDFSTRNCNSKRVMNYITTGGLFVLSAIITINNCMCMLLTNYSPFSKHGKIAVVFNTLSLFLTVFICTIQIVFLSRYFAEICSRICTIERLAWRNFSFDFMGFRRHFLRRVCIVVIAFVVPVIITLFTKPFKWNNVIVTIGLATQRAFVLLILLHVFFYVNLLNHLLRVFVRHVDKQASDTRTTATVRTINIHLPAAKQFRDEIHYFKLLHFNLWEISRKINNLFGWTIVAIFLQYFMFTIYNLYFAYNVFMDKRLNYVEFSRELSIQWHHCFIHHFTFLIFPKVVLQIF